MRTTNSSVTEIPKNLTPSAGLVLEKSVGQMSYFEMDEVPVREVSLIEQLDTNLSKLENLQAKHQFMMREIRYLMKV
ncbi:MAG: hypothetical protein LW875_01950 [Proteobacteria bacterium]|jgi:hypothetical protein|nr:hypothetical protein [Pseudomonadota bacterium]